jgi:16S rRNA (guanine966-N2)-methyltransferase
VRIISGKYAGRKLVDSSFLKDLRPTTDRNRQALFNLLTSGNFLRMINFKLDGSLVIDLCCGTGSIGLEAISRNAKMVIFIDNNRQHLEIVQKNIEMIDVSDKCKVIFGNSKNLPICDYTLDLIFLDPYYQEEDYYLIIDELIKKNYFSQNTLLVIESYKFLFDYNFFSSDLLSKKTTKKANKKNQKFDKLNLKNSNNLKDDRYLKLPIKIIDHRIYGSINFYFIINNNHAKHNS